MPSLSPSRANDFQRCPLLYRYRVIDRLPEPASPAAARGTLVHSVLERLFDIPRGERSPEAALDLLPGAFVDLEAKDPRVDQLFSDDADRDAWLASAADLVKSYFSLEDPDRLIPSARELLVEHTLDSGLTLRGYIDRIDIAPGSGMIRIVDYKTGKSPAPRYQGEMLYQLRFYALVVWLSKGELPAMVQLLFLGNRDIVRNEPTEGDLELTQLKTETIWKSITDMAAAGNFPPVKSPLCPWCSFQALCPLFGGVEPPLPDNTLTRLGLA